MTPFAAQPLVHCDPGELTPLPCSGAVSEEEALPVAIAVGVRNERDTLLRQAVTAREVDFRRRKRMYDRLELGCAQYFVRSEEHTSELQSLMRISYAVFCLKKTKKLQTKIKQSLR